MSAMGGVSTLLFVQICCKRIVSYFLNMQWYLISSFYTVFVPKFDVYDGNGEKKYRLRPDTCVGGCCVMCRCGGPKGKCCKVPYIIRDPNTVSITHT